MSFLNHIGLGWMDPTNELDKLGNAIKGGDLSALIKHLKSLFGDVEDRLAEVSELFEDSMEDAKKDMRHEMSRAKRKIVREARRDLELLQEEVRWQVDRRHAAGARRGGRGRVLATLPRCPNRLSAALESPSPSRPSQSRV